MCCGEWSDEVLMYVKLSFVFCTVFLYFVLNLKLCPKKPTYVKFVVISILKSILLINSIMSPNQPIKKWNRQKKKNSFREQQRKLVVPTEILSMEKYQRSHSLVQQNQRKAELQVHTVGHKRILPFHLWINFK